MSWRLNAGEILGPVDMSDLIFMSIGGSSHFE